ncbi:MAG: glycosyltransferase family 2 protein, partial [Alphaproteobacteria bacterium]
MDKVSVIIPVYNTEKFLPQCLNSIIYQTYKNLEIIIVNDGSTDNSDEICQTFAKHDKRIKIIYQTNSGVSAARNKGLLNATGDYVHFIDSDDYINLDYYEKIISGNKNINADIIATG